LIKGFGVIVVLILVAGAFWFGSSLKLVDRLGGLFNSGMNLFVSQPAVQKTPQAEFDLEAYPTMQVVKMFGENRGVQNDIVAVMFRNVYYFGKLKDPLTMQETGITSAVYYGLMLDQVYEGNKFIKYVDFLDQLKNIYLADVYEVLQSAKDRTLKLQEFLQQSKALFVEGNKLRQEIGLQVDELKVSLNSLTPDKTRYETDFFASLEQFKGEKTNSLFQSFVEVSQKQVELKAKVNALNKLLEYYDKILLKLKIRIEAIEQNQDALIGGIRVVNIPGSNIDLVVEKSSN